MHTQAAPSKFVLQGHGLTLHCCILPEGLRSCSSACVCSFVGGSSGMCCVPGRSKSYGCWQLGAQAVRQAAVMTAFDMFLSAIEQRLCHLLSLHTWRWACQCLPPLLFSLFAFWSLQREEMHEEWEADRKGMGRECSPSPEWQPGPHSCHWGTAVCSPCPAFTGSCAGLATGSKLTQGAEERAKRSSLHLLRKQVFLQLLVQVLGGL